MLSVSTVALIRQFVNKEGGREGGKGGGEGPEKRKRTRGEQSFSSLLFFVCFKKISFTVTTHFAFMSFSVAFAQSTEDIPPPVVLRILQ